MGQEEFHIICKDLFDTEYLSRSLDRVKLDETILRVPNWLGLISRKDVHVNSNVLERAHIEGSE